MNLLLLNGPRDPRAGANPNYRGTYRAHPTYCNEVTDSDELNQLFFWFLEEGGELGVVHDPEKARRFCYLWNLRLPPARQFEVIEVTTGQTPPRHGSSFRGFDVSAGYNLSLLWWGLTLPPQTKDLPSEIVQSYRSLSERFAPLLNQDGLFQDFSVAVDCRKKMIELQSLFPNLFEGESLEKFAVVGVYELETPVSRKGRKGGST